MAFLSEERSKDIFHFILRHYEGPVETRIIINGWQTVQVPSIDAISSEVPDPVELHVTGCGREDPLVPRGKRESSETAVEFSSRDGKGIDRYSRDPLDDLPGNGEFLGKFLVRHLVEKAVRVTVGADGNGTARQLSDLGFRHVPFFADP